MTQRTNRWLSLTTWACALATTGTACMGGPVDFNSGGAGEGGEADSGGTGAVGGSAGSGDTGGTGGTTGGAGGGPTDPYAPRTGSFKALVYSETKGFRHADSIAAGKQMFSDLAAQFDFEVTIPAEPESFRFTAASLADYEVVVFLNTTGDILDPEEEVAFEQWVRAKNGAFVGLHSATDTEHGWSFYEELTGQYFDLHTACCSEAEIVWAPDALDFPAVEGLPSPWLRSEEWFRFNQSPVWSLKPGFKILGTVDIQGTTHPVSFVREYDNYRSFYTSLGHEAPTFADTTVRRHVAGGLLWAVRRQALLE
jgi:type 1 glutamine amidotransferase